MFNLGFGEILVVAVLALILIGPKQLPDMARMLGRMMNEFKKATSELSGGVLQDIKKDLGNPFQEGLNRINEELSKVNNEVRNVATYKPQMPNDPPPAETSVPENITSEKNESEPTQS